MSNPYQPPKKIQSGGSWSATSILHMVCICVEGLGFMVVFFGAPPTIFMGVVIVGTVSSIVGSRQAGRVLPSGIAILVRILIVASWFGLLVLNALLWTNGISETLFRSVVGLRSVALLAIVYVNAKADVRSHSAPRVEQPMASEPPVEADS